LIEGGVNGFSILQTAAKNRTLIIGMKRNKKIISRKRKTARKLGAHELIRYNKVEVASHSIAVLLHMRYTPFSRRYTEPSVTALYRLLFTTLRRRRSGDENVADVFCDVSSCG